MPLKDTIEFFQMICNGDVDHPRAGLLQHWWYGRRRTRRYEEIKAQTGPK